MKARPATITINNWRISPVWTMVKNLENTTLVVSWSRKHGAKLRHFSRYVRVLANEIFYFILVCDW